MPALWNKLSKKKKTLLLQEEYGRTEGLMTVGEIPNGLQTIYRNSSIKFGVIR